MLQTEIYLDYLTGKLTQFAQITRSKSAMNLNDSAISAESLYREFFNELFGWHLISTNSYSSNAAGIDLVDTNDAVMVQITAQSGRQKIVHTLDEVDTNKYKDYHLLIMFITKPANNTRRQKYVIPDHIEFDPKHDILDVDSVLRLCQTASLVTLSRLDALCRNMFNDEQPKLQQVSSVSKVVQAIYVSPLDKLSDDQIPLAFDVQKKVDFNKFEPIQASLIDPLKLYYGVMLSIYDTFNSEGHFTLTLFQTIASVYEKVNVPYSGLSSAEIFLRMIDELVSIVNRSSNIDDSISQEDRILSCRMIMVHAFMDCKIFEDPEGYYAVAN